MVAIMSGYFLSEEEKRENALIMAKILERYARALRGGRFKLVSLSRQRNTQAVHYDASGYVGNAVHSVTWELYADTGEGRIKATLEESPKQFQRAENRRKA